MYIIIWDYQVKRGREKEFEQLYGPTGEWVQLFRQEVAYIKTALLHADSQPGRYLTIDCWTDKDSYDAFLKRESARFAEIDQQGEGLTEKEVCVGRFEG